MINVYAMTYWKWMSVNQECRFMFLVRGYVNFFVHSFDIFMTESKHDLVSLFV